MRLFGPLYDMAMRWASHRYAVWFLGGMSFAESSFFPVPPDVMLLPMSVARPKRAMFYAMVTTIASLLGGLAGYAIGYFGFELIQPWIERMGYADKYDLARAWFDQWGFWVVLVAGFSPIPYKVFTIAAGVAVLNLPLFLAASFVGRGGRFFLVAVIAAWGGPKVQPWVEKYVERIGWATVALLVVAIAIYRFR